MRRVIGISVAVLLVLSLALNVALYLAARRAPRFVSFENANTRDTYESIHHVREAQGTATGRGIKVGILDKYFGYGKHPELYAGGMDFGGDGPAFEQISEHGYWMATTLKEIAPGVEVLALNVRTSDKAREAAAIVRAIDWAVGQHVKILTYSAEAFGEPYRAGIDDAVRRAHERGVVTTFVHYPLEENMLPTGLFPAGTGEEERAADLSIYHFDYNTLLLSVYEKHRKLVEAGARPRSGDEVPYLSISSTSPVLAGFVAMMMEVKGELSPAEYKRVLVETSRTIEYKGRKVERVVDAPAALQYMKTTFGDDRPPQ